MHNVVQALLLALLLLAGCAQAPAAAVVVGELRIAAPARVVAGAPAAVVVLGAAPDGTAATLTAIGSYGPRSYSGQFVGGAAPFVLPPAATEAAGAVELVVQAGAARATARLTVAPGEVALVAAPLLAPRSICADGGEASVITIVAQDAYGNLLGDGARVALQSRDPQGRERSERLRAQGGVAMARYTAGAQAGRVGLRAVVGGSAGDETPLTVIACDLAPIRLSAAPPRLPADGRHSLTLRTAPILDGANNPVADGTLVLFVADLPDGPRRITAQTLSGVAEAQLVAATTPGIGSVHAVALGRVSAAITIQFLHMYDE